MKISSSRGNRDLLGRVQWALNVSESAAGFQLGKAPRFLFYSDHVENLITCRRYTTPTGVRTDRSRVPTTRLSHISFHPKQCPSLLFESGRLYTSLRKLDQFPSVLYLPLFPAFFLLQTAVASRRGVSGSTLWGIAMF